MADDRLTGRTGVRLHKPLFGTPILVLTVEVERGEGPPDHHGSPMWLPGIVWRDARPDDLLRIKMPGIA